MGNEQEYIPKPIHCPKCGKKVLTWDGRSTTYPTATCLDCWKLIIYQVDKDNVLMTDVPERQSSSGAYYYQNVTTKKRKS